MATPCLIAIHDDEKGYLASYCHWDGYHDHMWPLLTEHYNTEELVRKLINLGDASSIDERLEPTPGVAHSYNEPEEGVCVFYHRDKGDSWNECNPLYYDSKESLRRVMSHVYVWEKDHWEEL